MRNILIAFALIAASSVSAGQLSPEEFDRLTKGRTLFYSNGGAIYGVERYLPGRRVIWSFDDGDCQYGQWYAEAGQICFLYEDGVTPQCWAFEQTAQGLVAYYNGHRDETQLIEQPNVGREMTCKGPEVGV